MPKEITAEFIGDYIRRAYSKAIYFCVDHHKAPARVTEMKKRGDVVIDGWRYVKVEKLNKE